MIQIAITNKLWKRMVIALLFVLQTIYDNTHSKMASS